MGVWSGVEERRGDRLGGQKRRRHSRKGARHRQRQGGWREGRAESGGSVEQQEIKLQAINQAVKPSRLILPNLLSLSLDSFIHSSIS